MIPCGQCHRETPPEAITHHGETPYCEVCRDRYLLQCGGCGVWMPRYPYPGPWRSRLSRPLCEACLPIHHVKCVVCGWWDLRSTLSVEGWCERCVEHYQCATCHRTISPEAFFRETIHHRGRRYCHACYATGFTACHVCGRRLRRTSLRRGICRGCREQVAWATVHVSAEEIAAITQTIRQEVAYA